jgi:LmbE family N-acetylglucosaminyl deacetylase
MSPATGFQHIVLSPHLDDAALSCGGLIAGAVSAGERVLVVTICSAAPDPAGPFNPLASQLHTDWRLAPDQVVSARLREDAAALAVLGAEIRYLGELDCIYRLPDVYDSSSALFGAPHAADPLQPRLQSAFTALAAEFPHARFYAPLAIGEHVDHQLTFLAAAGLPNLSFYEDFPYVIRDGAREQRLARIGRQFTLQTQPIDAVIAQRIQSIDCYASQLANLFGSNAAMPEAVRRYAAAIAPQGAAYGECYRTLS